jgi:hypothetical protein
MEAAESGRVHPPGKENVLQGVEPVEGCLADRLWEHQRPGSILAKRLARVGVKILDCDLQIWFEDDSAKRSRIEFYGSFGV